MKLLEESHVQDTAKATLRHLNNLVYGHKIYIG